MHPLKRLLRDKRGQQIAVMGIIVACITVAVGSAIGLTVTAKTESVFWAMKLSANANTAFSDTVATVYGSWPMMGLIVISLIAAAILIAIAIIR